MRVAYDSGLQRVVILWLAEWTQSDKSGRCGPECGRRSFRTCDDACREWGWWSVVMCVGSGYSAAVGDCG